MDNHRLSAHYSDKALAKLNLGSFTERQAENEVAA